MCGPVCSRDSASIGPRMSQKLAEQPESDEPPETAESASLQQHDTCSGTAILQVDQLQVDQLRRQLDDLNLEFHQLQTTLRVTEGDHKQAFQLQNTNPTHRAAASSVSTETAEKQQYAAAVIQARLRQCLTRRDLRAVVQAHNARVLELRKRAAATLDFEVAALKEEAAQVQVERDEMWQRALQDGSRVQREHLELEYAAKVKDAVAKVTAAADVQVRAAQEEAARRANELASEQSKNSKLVQQLERARQREHQWRGIAWKAVHGDHSRPSAWDEPHTITGQRGQRASRPGNSPCGSTGSPLRYPPPLSIAKSPKRLQRAKSPTDVKPRKVQPTLKLPDKQARRQLFNRMDVNGHGQLSLAEIDNALAEGVLGQALGLAAFDNKPAVMRAYMAAATSGEHFIQRSKFAKLLFYIVYFNNIGHLVETFDSSHDRWIDVAEFAAGCAEVGIRLSADEAAKEFALCDADRKGVILFDEWCTWCADYEYQKQRARRAQLRKEQSPPQHQAAAHYVRATTVTGDTVEIEDNSEHTDVVCTDSVSDKPDSLPTFENISGNCEQNEQLTTVVDFVDGAVGSECALLSEHVDDGEHGAGPQRNDL